MKKLFFLLVVVAGIGFLLLGNVGGVAKRVIERAGTETMGTAVRVGSVSLDLADGSAVLTDFRVANPPGFSNQPLMRFDELRVALDVRSLNQEVVRVRRITSTNPVVHYELSDGRANLDVVLEHLARQQPAEPVPDEDVLLLGIDEIFIEGIGGSLLSDQLPRQVNVTLGDVRLRDMQGTPEQIALQIARPLFDQVSSQIGSALVRAAADLLEEELTDRAGQAVDGLLDRLRRN